MKKSILLKLLVLAVCAAMLLSLFACDKTEDPTEAPTTQQTEKPTEKEPVDEPTDEPTQAPTDEPTDEPTQAPTDEPTQAPTDEPTQAPTEEPTQAPTEEPTQAPTEEPTQGTTTEDPTQGTKPEDSTQGTKPEEPTQGSKPEEPTEPKPTCDGNHEVVARQDKGHYVVECAICGTERGQVEAHTYETVEGKPTCSVCDWVASCEGVHAFETDDNNHWRQACNACGEPAVAVGEHTFEKVEGKYACTVCGLEKLCDGNHALVSDGKDGHHVPACDICETPAGEVVAHEFTVNEENTIKSCACGYSECVAHALSRVTDGNNYLIQCSTCQEVMYNYNTDISAALKYRDDYAVGAYTNLVDGNLAINQYNQIDTVNTNSRYARVQPKPDSTRGEFRANNILGSGSWEGRNYLIVKFRIGENGLGQNTMDFFIGPVLASAVTVQIPVSEDNQWHTVVIDLAACIDGYDSKATTYASFRPFGSNADGEIKVTTLTQNPNAYVDYSYAAGCATLEDVAKVIGEDTYEFVTASGVSQVKYTETHELVCGGEHTELVSVGADGHQTAACQYCGEEAGWIQSHTLADEDGDGIGTCECGYTRCMEACTYARVTDGNNYLIQCSKCSEVVYDYNTDTSAAIAYRDDNAVGSYTNWPGEKALAQFEVGSPRFSRIYPKAGVNTPQMTQLLGGTARENLNYLVIKFRVGFNGMDQTTMHFYVNVYDEAHAFDIAVSEDGQWHTVIVDLKARVGDGTVYDGNFNKTLTVRPFGNKTSVSKDYPDAYIDFAYAAGCATLEDAQKVAGGIYELSVSKTENVKYYADGTLYGTKADEPLDATFARGEDGSATASVTIPAKTTLYFSAFGINGMALTANGTAVEVTSGMFPMSPSTFAITNDTEEAVTYALVATYPVGSWDNPAELVIGDNSATVEAGSQGYLFTWTATEAGTLTLEFANENGWTYTINNMTTYLYGDTQWSDSDPVVNPATITVAAGDEIQIMVNTYDPANMWNAPAGTVTVKATFAAGEVVEPDEPSVEPEVPAEPVVLIDATYEKAVPAELTYITNNSAYPDPSFYGDGGLKMNFVNMGMQTVAFESKSSVTVTLVVNALNENTKSETSADIDAFTFYGLDANGDVVATATLNTIASGDNEVTLAGEGIVAVKVIMTDYYFNGTKCCNVSVGGLKVVG